MEQREILKTFQDSGALMQGHFLLSSGLHSGRYLQCARVLENPQVSEKLCRMLAENFKNEKVNLVIGPAMGGIILAYDLARILGARALFAERDSGLPAHCKEGQAGKMCLRRGFSLSSKDRVLVAEDVITTGGSLKEVIELVKASGAKIVGVCALADRSQKTIDFGARFASLIKIDIPAFKLQDCPLCKEKLPLVKPGSRK